MTKCPKCDGKGATKSWISEPCAYCGGTGELPDDFAQMMKLRNCKKCGANAVFSGVFDDPTTYRFPECMKCGARAEGNSVSDSWYERAKKWNEQNMVTNEEWLNNLAWDVKAYWLANTCGKAMLEYSHNGNAEKMTLDYWKTWLKQPHENEVKE